METSILNTIKKALNVLPEDTAFDIDILMAINGALAELQQLGIGPVEGFTIEDDSSKWEDFVEDAGLQHIRNMASQYVLYKTRLAFDPPQIGYLIDLLKKQIEECAVRLTVAREEALSAVEP